MAESDRINFMYVRDGLPATLEWAKMVRSLYRKSVLQNGKHGRKFHFASTREYKRKFIYAYWELKRFIESMEC